MLINVLFLIINRTAPCRPDGRHGWRSHLYSARFSSPISARRRRRTPLGEPRGADDGGGPLLSSSVGRSGRRMLGCRGGGPRPVHDGGDSCGCLGGTTVWPGGAASAARFGTVHGARARWISKMGSTSSICSLVLGWAVQLAGRLQLRRWPAGTYLVGSGWN